VNVGRGGYSDPRYIKTLRVSRKLYDKSAKLPQLGKKKRSYEASKSS